MGSKYRIVIAPELIAEGRHLYEETDTPVRVIAKRMGLTRSTLNYRIADWKWVRRHASAADPPLTQELPAATPAAPPSDGASTPADEPALAFAEWMKRVLNVEMAVIERTLKVLGPASNAEAERTTRILASITRTLQDLHRRGAESR